MQSYLALILIFFVGINTSFAHNSALPSSFQHYPLEQVNEHIYVVHGAQDLPGPQNCGFMNNPAAILTDNGVIIVDPGSSAEIGKLLLKKISVITDKPVIAVFNTHVHGDHWLGNHGVRKGYPGVPVYAHERMIERVDAGEGEDWIKLLMGMTEGAITDTRAVAPNVGLKGGEELALDGVTLRVHHTGHAHTDHDLMLEVVEDKGLFFGDVVAAKRVPNSGVPQDASFKGSITAIQAMLKRPVDIYIPGHGRSGRREVPEASLAFLEELYAEVTKYFDQGLESYEMKEKVKNDMAKYKDWNNFNEMGSVINFVYQEVERDNF